MDHSEYCVQDIPTQKRKIPEVIPEKIQAEGIKSMIYLNDFVSLLRIAALVIVREIKRRRNKNALSRGKE